MENQEHSAENLDNTKMWQDFEKRQRRGKIMGGLLLIAIGSIFLLREVGVEIPHWLFSWKMLLIGIGIVTAVKHKFMHPSWILFVSIGGIFLLNDFYPEMQIKPFIIPVLLIIMGLVVMFKPRSARKRAMFRYMKRIHEQHHYSKHHRHQNPFDSRQQMMREHYKGCEQTLSDDYIDSSTFFAGVKKNIISKKFTGGEVSNVFGGTELNLMQADMEEKATLEITQVFGGTKLLVPAHWEIKSEIVAVLGSVEDKRPVQPKLSNEPAKVLVLVGTVVCGGIEIKSF